MNPTLKNIAFIVVSLAAVGSPFIKYGASDQRLNTIEKMAYAQEEKNQTVWSNISDLRNTTIRHEALIPVLQQDVRDIKNGMRDNNKKLDQVLLAVKQ